MVRINLCIGFLLGILLSAAFADDVSVDVRIDRYRVSVGETFVLTIDVSADGRISEPTISGLEGFEIVGRTTYASFSIVNMKVSRSNIFEYRIVALNEGTYSIGPFRIKVDGSTYEADPIQIEVIKSSASSTPAPMQRPEARSQTSGSPDDVLLIASVDKRRAYVGEQITYTLKFAYRIRILSNPDYNPPDFQGFWSETIGDEGPEVEEINGVRYYVLTSRTALFPISTGRYRIGEAMVKFVAEYEHGGRDPFGIFGSDPFNFVARANRRQGVVKSDPIEIEVLPLPKEGMPDDFTGAVGKFDISVETRSQEVRVGESLTLVAKIEGVGNLRSVDRINVPRIEGFRVFAPKPSSTNWKKGNLVGGSKKFDLVLVAEKPGNYTIEGFEFVYFDPVQAKYIRANAPAVGINVLPAEAGYDGNVSQGAYIARKEIRYIKTDFSVRDDLYPRLGGTLRSVIPFGPIAIVAFGIMFSLVRKHVSKGKRFRGKAALERAVGEIRKAIALVEGSGDLSKAAGLASQALRSYIGLLLGISPQEVDLFNLEEMPRISEETRKNLHKLLEDLDRVRFAPIGCEKEEIKRLLETSEYIIRGIWKEWRE